MLGFPLSTRLGGGFKYFLNLPLFGEDSHFDSYFSKGLVQPHEHTFRNKNAETSLFFQ